VIGDALTSEGAFGGALQFIRSFGDIVESDRIHGGALQSEGWDERCVRGVYDSLTGGSLVSGC